MSATESYIKRLEDLKDGDLGILRSLAGKPLSETVPGFDMFAGLWWPLRQKSQRAPRREVAWLVAKLYAFRPLPDCEKLTLARQLARSQSNKDPTKRKRYEDCFDDLITVPFGLIEPHLRWALNEVRVLSDGINWVQLTDDLSGWHRSDVRQRWVDDFIDYRKETTNAD